MESFQAIHPSLPLAPYVKQYWFLTEDDVTQASQRFIPAGSMGLVFNRGERIFSSRENAFLSSSHVFGQTTMYSDLTFNRLNLIIVVLHPVGGKIFLRMPLNELKEQNVSIDVLGNPRIMELEDRLKEATDNRACVYWIEQFLLRYLYQIEEYNFKRLFHVFNSIDSGESDVYKLARTACLGYKQFKRVFTEYIGLNPKEFLRINRFRRTSYILQIKNRFTLDELAYECGYYDKSHLIKDVKEFSGYTPIEFRLNSDPYSDYMSLFRAFFVNKSSLDTVS